MWKLTWCINDLANRLRSGWNCQHEPSILHNFLSRPHRHQKAKIKSFLECARLCGIITTFDKRICKSTHSDMGWFSLARLHQKAFLLCNESSIYKPLWIDWVFRKATVYAYNNTTMTTTKTEWLRCDISKVETWTHSDVDWYFEVVLAEFDKTFKSKLPGVRDVVSFY